MSKPVVAIVGRPNVGKSTLFNVLAGSTISIVKDTPGVTRDRIYADCTWLNNNFTLIDTGGIEPDSKDIILAQMREQAQIAIDTADVIIFIVDVRQGLVDADSKVADMLRKSKKPVVLAVNKVDSMAKFGNDVYEFYNLGIGDPVPVSAASRLGLGELLDEVVKYFREDQTDDSEDDRPRIAIVGKPNVGKSSTINALIGEERNIVTDIAGTTRDTLNTRYNRFGYDFLLVDTAGLRKKAKVSEDVEFYSVMRSIRAIEESDVCILLIDATRGMEAQDLNIFHLIERNRKGVVIVVNKWDLVEKDGKTLIEYEKSLREKIAPFKDVDIIFASALTKQRLLKVLEAALQVYANRTQKIKTSELNRIMLEAIENYPPPSLKGKYVKIKYITQLPTHAPSFAFYCNLPQYVKDPYKRYLENQIRENWKFTGVPIQIFMRKK